MSKELEAKQKALALTMEKIDNKYEVGDWLIYPKHGLGKAIDYEVQTILKKKTEFLVASLKPFCFSYSCSLLK